MRYTIRLEIIMTKFRVILLILLAVCTSAFAQSKGSISGKISDKSTSDDLIGANIFIVGSSTGTSSDIDGSYSIRSLVPGRYQIRVSYISYQTMVVNNILIEAGKDTRLNLQLEPAATELNEIVVSAEALKSTEVAILNIQKNSLGIVDGISAELIKKNNSSDGTDVLKRMTSVTISDGKYVFVRGVGDRYNNTLLNGSNLPSTDPEKKSFSYDIFPASLIENILTSKTFIPDKPADFSGGLVEINTIEFPSKLILDFSVGSSYSSNTTGKNIQTYSGGKRDFLGYDDGTRDLPSVIPNQRLDRNIPQLQLQEFGRSFSDNWATKTSTAPLNSNFKLSLGNKLNIGDEDIVGYIASLTYSASNDLKETYQANYTFEGPRFIYNGTNSTYSVNWGALLNFSYKFAQKHKLSLKNIYNQSADDETIQYEGDYSSYLQFRKVISLRYISRSLQSTQLIGQHFFNLLNGLNVDWNMNISNSKREKPDARRYIYARDVFSPEEQLQFLLDQSLATRYFGNLDDKVIGTNWNFKIKPFENNSMPTIKFGYFFDKKDRNFDARVFGFRNGSGGDFVQEQQILFKDINEIFQPENINPSFLEIAEITQPTDSYVSNQTINAAYLMTDFSLFDKIKIITGVRLENAVQKMNSKSRTGEPINVESKFNDLFPSVNIAYKYNDKLNLRLAYSKTIARPEFRELATFTYFDFVSNELVQGNPKLIRSLIENYDLKVEYYPAPQELFAVGFFYKNFQDPIEQILISSSALEPIRSYENGKDAKNFGVEFELRKTLGFISTVLNDFMMIGNLSIIKSSIELEDRGFQSATRPLQGQADFIFNLGLYWETSDSDLSASLIYNKVGEKIAKVGFGGLGDVVELARDQIDFSFSKKLWSNLKLKIAAKDLFAKDIKFIQQTPDGDKPSEITKRGQNISVGLSFQF